MSPPEPTASRASGAELAFRAGIASAAALLLWLALPVLRGEIYVADDLGRFHLPLRAFYARCLEKGWAFEWMPDLFCGFDLHGEGQVGMLHPLHWLLYRFAPLNAAFGIELLLSYTFLLAGTFLLLSRRGLPRGAALLGAITLAFSSFPMLHWVHPNAVAVAAHLPWLLLAIDAAMSQGDPRRARRGGQAVALLTGSQLLLGHPQAVWLSLVGEASWITYLLLEGRGTRRRVGLAALAAGKLVGLLIGAAQLLPTIETASLSVRSAPGETFLQAGSLHWGNLLQLVEPYLFAGRVLARERQPYDTHEMGFYAGALAPVLAAWILSRRGGAHRRLALGACALFAVSVLLAAGGWIPPLHRVVTSLPGVGMFRNSARALLLAELALAVLAALAFADLAASSARPRRAQVLAVLSVPLVSLAAVLALRGIGEPAGSLLRWELAGDARIWLGPALCSAAALLVLLGARGSRWALAAMPVFAVADLGAYGWTRIAETPPTTVEELAAAAPYIPDLERAMLVPPTNVPVLDRMRLTNGYAALAPRRRLGEAAAGSQGAVARAWMRVSGTRWLIVDGEARRLQGELPRARLVARTRLWTGAEDLASIEVAEEALVDGPIALPPGPAQPAEIAEEAPGRILLHTQASADRLLVLNESWHPGWRLVVDAWPAETVRVNGDFLGAVVPAGAHDLWFRFEPYGLRIGRRLSVLGLLALLAPIVLGRRRQPFPRR